MNQPTGDTSAPGPSAPTPQPAPDPLPPGTDAPSSADLPPDAAAPRSGADALPPAGDLPSAATEEPPGAGAPPPADAAAGRPPKKARTGAYIRLGIIVLVIAFLLVFVFQNTHRVSMEFLWADFSVSLWLMLLIVLVLGLIVGYVLSWLQSRRRRAKRAEGSR